MSEYKGLSIFSHNMYVTGETELSRLKREVDDLRNRLSSLNDKPSQLGIVLSTHERDGHRYAVLNVAGATIEKKLVQWSKYVQVGMQARILQDGAQPIVYSSIPVGGMLVVVEALHNGAVEFTSQSVTRTATVGLQCKVGDRVQLDTTGLVVVRNLGPAVATRAFTKATGVDWDDIGGLEDVKRQLREAIEDPFLKKEIHERYGKKPVKGIMLHGVPGGGKTMLGRACATSMARLHGKTEVATGFQLLKGPELLHGIVGSSESNVRRIFSEARSHRAEHGYPAIVFIDEADGILNARGRNSWEGMERTIVPQFLAEMDGFDTTDALFLIATNRPDIIDPAFLREGRIGIQIKVGYADEAMAIEVFKRCLKGLPAPATLPTDAAKELFHQRYVVKVITEKAGRERRTLGQYVTGAMVTGIVEDAKILAMRRAIAGDDTGITLDDVKAAIADAASGEFGQWNTLVDVKSVKAV
jgi:proteasome-associated ATPase